MQHDFANRKFIEETQAYLSQHDDQYRKEKKLQRDNDIMNIHSRKHFDGKQPVDNIEASRLLQKVRNTKNL